jgi:hypothetical protein
MQAVVPLFAGVSIPVTATEALETINAEIHRLHSAYGITGDYLPLRLSGGNGTHVMIAVVGHHRLEKMLERLLDPEQFLSPHGLRSLSRYHRDHPYVYRVAGQDYSVDYMPAESRNRMFGGNSNWRGPVWMPMNFLFVQALNSYARFLGDDFLVPDPAMPEQRVPLAVVADHMADRLSGLVVRDAGGRRAVFGDNDYFQNDPHWRDLVPFHEYFDGDDGHGVGASHQTGWTATIALLLQFGGRLRFDDLSH